MDHLEAIVKLDNIIDKDFIKKIIPFINHKGRTPTSFWLFGAALSMTA